MGISQKLVGTHYRHPDYYVAEREKVREYARAVHSEDAASLDDAAAAALGHSGVAAPLTFMSVFSYTAQRAMLESAGADALLQSRSGSGGDYRGLVQVFMGGGGRRGGMDRSISIFR